MTTPYGLVPFDLAPPAGLLVPNPHDRSETDKQAVDLGTVGDEAVLEVTTWKSCRPGCKSPWSHDAGHSVRLRVPCDSLPHCQACECGSEHVVALTDEQVAALKSILP